MSASLVNILQSFYYLASYASCSSQAGCIVVSLNQEILAVRLIACGQYLPFS